MQSPTFNRDQKSALEQYARFQPAVDFILQQRYGPGPGRPAFSGVEGFGMASCPSLYDLRYAGL